MKKIIRILLVCIFVLSLFCGIASCKKEESNSTIAIVHFELCTQLTTTSVKDREVEKGSLVKEPNVIVRGENPNNSEICGWYTDENYTTKWDFDNDVVTKNMTLYAKWIDAHVITYYCKTQDYDPYADNTPERTTATVRDGEYAERRDVIADGYEILGYFEDEDYTKEFDFTKPITSDTAIYIKTSDYLYYNAQTMDRNFAVAPTLGASQTDLDKKVVTDNGKEYLDVCFGTTSEANGVAVASITAVANVLLDASQHIVIKFKIPEGSTANVITIYPMVMNKDTEWSQGGAFRAYAWLDTLKDDSGKPLDITKSEDGTYTWRIPFDKLSYNTDTYKVSTWANAVKLGQFRIDVRCKDHSKEDPDPQAGWTFPEQIDNTIWFEEIRGESCDEYKNPQDTINYQRDEENALVEKANTQTAVNGWIMPLNRDKVTVNKGSLYNLVDGSLLSVPYGNKTGELELSGVEGIEVDNLKILKVVYKNLGGSNNMEVRITIKNTFGEDKLFTIPVTMERENKDFVTFEYSMAEYSAFKGTLKSVAVVYKTNGVDNAILLNQLSFEDFKANYIAGVNFQDPKFAGLTANGANLEFDAISLATKVSVTEDKASLSGEYKYNTIAYATADITVKSSGITKVTVSYLVGETNYSLVYNLGVVTEWQTLSANIEGKGEISQITFTFDGVGEIYIKDFKLKVDKNRGIDFSDSFWAGRITREKWNANNTVTFDNATSSTSLYGTSDTSSTEGRLSGDVRVYVGHVGKDLGFTNILANKNSKIYIVYQNPYKRAKMHFKIQTVANTTENLYTPKEGTAYFFPECQILSNMGENEWAVYEIDLSTKVQTEEDFLISYFVFAGDSANIKVRAIVVA